MIISYRLLGDVWNEKDFALSVQEEISTHGGAPAKLYRRIGISWLSWLEWAEPSPAYRANCRRSPQTEVGSPRPPAQFTELEEKLKLPPELVVVPIEADR